MNWKSWEVNNVRNTTANLPQEQNMLSTHTGGGLQLSQSTMHYLRLVICVTVHLTPSLRAYFLPKWTRWILTMRPPHIYIRSISCETYYLLHLLNSNVAILWLYKMRPSFTFNSRFKKKLTLSLFPTTSSTWAHWTRICVDKFRLACRQIYTLGVKPGRYAQSRCMSIKDSINWWRA